MAMNDLLPSPGAGTLSTTDLPTRRLSLTCSPSLAMYSTGAEDSLRVRPCLDTEPFDEPRNDSSHTREGFIFAGYDRQSQSALEGKVRATRLRRTDGKPHEGWDGCGASGRSRLGCCGAGTLLTTGLS